MLVLRRRDGEWIEIVHRSGDVLRVRVYDLERHHCNLAFEDAVQNFAIKRPERKAPPPCP